MNTSLGGKLINRIADTKTKKRLLMLAIPTLIVPRERIIETWDIATGAYSPLTGFSDKENLLSVLRTLKTPKGVFWPVPIILDIDAQQKKEIGESKGVFLAEAHGKKVVYLEVKEIYEFPKKFFNKGVFGTNDAKHPGVKRTNNAKKFLVGGDITWIGGRFSTIRPSFTPEETRKLFAKRKWKRIVAFHTRNVPHRGHEHVMREGLRKTDGLLVQPLIGRKYAGDFRNEIVAKAYQYFSKHVLPQGKAMLSFLPYSAYFAGPREALLTAVIRKNFGCTHFIVGRDHTGVGDFYTLPDYVKAIKKNKRAMGIEIFHFGRAFYCTGCKRATFEEDCPHDEKFHVHAAGTTIRKFFLEGKLPPSEMMRPEMVKILLKEKKLFI